MKWLKGESTECSEAELHALIATERNDDYVKKQGLDPLGEQLPF